MNVPIVAAGESKRYGQPKQLIDISGEPLILRVCRQVKERHAFPVVFTKNTMIKDICSLYNVVEPDRNDTMLHTIRSTENVWGNKSIILYSDTIYSKHIMDTMLSLNGFHMLLTSCGTEGLGYAIINEHKDLFIRALNGVINNEHRNKDGRLAFQLYNHLLDIMPVNMRANFGVKVPTNDYTDDIDYVFEYNRFKDNIINKNLLNDLRRST